MLWLFPTGIIQTECIWKFYMSFCCTKRLRRYVIPGYSLKRNLGKQSNLFFLFFFNHAADEIYIYIFYPDVSKSLWGFSSRCCWMTFWISSYWWASIWQSRLLLCNSNTLQCYLHWPIRYKCIIVLIVPFTLQSRIYFCCNNFPDLFNSTSYCCVLVTSFQNQSYIIQNLAPSLFLIFSLILATTHQCSPLCLFPFKQRVYKWWWWLKDMAGDIL